MITAHPAILVSNYNKEVFKKRAGSRNHPRLT
jgi:hypothetical protein